MNIPEICPGCGAQYDKDGKFDCGSEWISGKAFQTQFCRVNQAAKELLENPYPWDLLDIRKKVENDYDDEQDAKENMDAYCTAEYFEDQRVKHKDALRKLKETIYENTLRGVFDRNI